LTYHVCPPDEAPTAAPAEPAVLVADPTELVVGLELLDVSVTG
jgi:hypothetical protein